MIHSHYSGESWKELIDKYWNIIIFIKMSDIVQQQRLLWINMMIINEWNEMLWENEKWFKKQKIEEGEKN